MSSKSVSVLISTMCRGDWRASIESVLEQDYEPFEVILVIDNPNHDAVGLDEFQARHPALIVVHNEQNIGLTRSLNKAAGRASGDIYVRHDDDDFSLPGRFQKLTAFLERESLDIATSYGRIQYDFSPIAQIEKSPLDDVSIKKELEVRNCLSHPTLAITANAFNRIGGYNESFRYAQDYELYLRAKRYDLKFGCLDEPLIHQVLGEQSVTFAKRRVQMIYSFAAQLLHNADKGCLDRIFPILRRFVSRFFVPQSFRRIKHRIHARMKHEG